MTSSLYGHRNETAPLQVESDTALVTRRLQRAQLDFKN